MKRKILITLAAGKTGFATSSILLEKGFPVKAFVRSKGPKALELEQKGAELVIGNFDDENALRQALVDVDAVYYCYPYKVGLPTDIQLFIRLAKASNIKTIVFMGQRIADFEDTGSLLTNEIRQAYELLQQSGLEVIYFAPGYFADNVFVLSEQVLQLGIMPNIFKTGKNPWISIGDMARCIAALLMHPAPYYGKKLYPTGPASISAAQIARIFSDVKGSKVSMITIPNWLFLKAGMMSGGEYGFNHFAILQGSLYNKQMQMNRFDITPTSIVKELTGNEAEDFETITRQYFAQSKYAKKNLATRVKAFLKLLILPFYPMPNTSSNLQAV